MLDFFFKSRQWIGWLLSLAGCAAAYLLTGQAWFLWLGAAVVLFPWALWGLRRRMGETDRVDRR